MMTPEIDGADRLMISDLITQFFACLDGGDPDGLAALFVEDARLDMGVAGRPAAEGRSAIRAAFASRPAGRRTRHNWFSLAFSPHAVGGRAKFQTIAYASEGGSPAAKLVNLCDTGLDLVRDAADGSWRIGTLERTVVFVFD